MRWRRCARGAVQVQGTINGYGERVGNCNLTTMMPALQLKMGIELGLDLTGLRDLAHFVDELANVPHDIRAPYVGVAAFTHKGGLHVHAVQKLARSYEHIDPSLVGNERVITISGHVGTVQRHRQSREVGLQDCQGRPRGGEDPRGSEEAGERRLRIRSGGGFIRHSRAKGAWAAPSAFRTFGVSLHLPGVPVRACGTSAKPR